MHYPLHDNPTVYLKYLDRGKRLRERISKRRAKLLRPIKNHLKLKRNQRQAIYIALAIIIALLFGIVWGQRTAGVKATLNFKRQKLEWLKSRQSLSAQLEQVKGQKASSEAQAKKNAAKATDLQRRIDRLNAQLQAKREQQSLLVRAAEAITPTVYAEPTGCNDAKSCIYWHESGNDPTSTNSLGCYGIGQDCNGIVKSRCGADYACQDAYFTQYMSERYGTWDNAWAVWQSQHWW